MMIAFKQYVQDHLEKNQNQSVPTNQLHIFVKPKPHSSLVVAEKEKGTRTTPLETLSSHCRWTGNWRDNCGQLGTKCISFDNKYYAKCQRRRERTGGTNKTRTGKEVRTVRTPPSSPLKEKKIIIINNNNNNNNNNYTLNKTFNKTLAEKLKIFKPQSQIQNEKVQEGYQTEKRQDKDFQNRLKAREKYGNPNYKWLAKEGRSAPTSRSRQSSSDSFVIPEEIWSRTNRWETRQDERKPLKEYKNESYKKGYEEDHEEGREEGNEDDSAESRESSKDEIQKEGAKEDESEKQRRFEFSRSHFRFGHYQIPSLEDEIQIGIDLSCRMAESVLQ